MLPRHWPDAQAASPVQAAPAAARPPVVEPVVEPVLEPVPEPEVEPVTDAAVVAAIVPAVEAAAEPLVVPAVVPIDVAVELPVPETPDVIEPVPAEVVPVPDPEQPTAVRISRSSFRTSPGGLETASGAVLLLARIIAESSGVGRAPGDSEVPRHLFSRPGSPCAALPCADNARRARPNPTGLRLAHGRPEAL